MKSGTVSPPAIADGPWISTATLSNMNHIRALDIAKDKGMSEQYLQVLTRWTREKIIYSQFDTQAHISATLRSPEFNRAYLQEYARLYELSGDELKNYETVKVHGNKKSKTALLCWGSNKGVCIEAAKNMGLKVIQPVVLTPFPLEQFRKALSGVTKLITVENNATGQLAKLIKCHSFDINEKILKYDGRSFSVDELEDLVKDAVK